MSFNLFSFKFDYLIRNAFNLPLKTNEIEAKIGQRNEFTLLEDEEDVDYYMRKHREVALMRIGDNY